MATFHISVVRPPGYLHSSCFHEVALALHAALQALGHNVTAAEGIVASDAVNIVFGAHLLQEEAAMHLPPSTVVYNLEQIGGSALPCWYRGLAGRYQIWDYTPVNLAQWSAFPCLHSPALVPVAYMPQLRRIVAAPVQDIDVLFYGSITPRRQPILQAIHAAGLNLHCGFGLYGAQRDDAIARAKIVLNLHAHATQMFEIVRVSYLLANSKAVVSEPSPDIGYLAEAVALATPDEMVATCRELLTDDARREALEERGFRVFSERTMLDSLSEALSTVS